MKPMNPEEIRNLAREAAYATERSAAATRSTEIRRALASREVDLYGRLMYPNYNESTVVVLKVDSAADKSELDRMFKVIFGEAVNRYVEALEAFARGAKWWESDKEKALQAAGATVRGDK